MAEAALLLDALWVIQHDVAFEANVSVIGFADYGEALTQTCRDAISVATARLR